MELNISQTPDEVLLKLAAYFVEVAEKSIKSHGRFSVSLSGGNSPKKLHSLLAAAPFSTQIDWTKVDFFFGDERNVPQDDKDSNYLMAKQTLFEPLNIPDSQIFPVETALGPEEAAKAYTKTILEYFKGREPRFDLIILGLGDNSHTASLFPHTPVLHDDTVSVQALYIDEVKMFRITKTAPLINLAHHIAFLVYGEGKALAVRHIIEDERNIDEYPAQLIAPVDGDLVWFMDEPAAAGLAKK